MSHARLSPSSAHRWMVCPASVRMQATYPSDDRSSPAAIDGTHTHTMLEMLINESVNFGWKPLAAEGYVGRTLEDHDGKFVIDILRARRAVFALDYIRGRVFDLDAIIVLPETKINTGARFGRDDCYGTSDCVIVSDDFLEVVDYKDGMGQVDAVANVQMASYMSGALDKFAKMTGIKNLRMTIIQPKMKDIGKQPIQHWDISKDEFVKWFHPLFDERSKATDDEDAPFVPDDKACHWCKHKNNCVARAGETKKEIKTMIETITDVKTDSAESFDMFDMFKSISQLESESLSDAQIVALIESEAAVKSMLDVIEGAKAEAMTRLEAGKNIEGIKAVSGRGSTAWAEDDEGMEAVFKKMGIPKTAMYESKLISPAKAKKLVWKKGDEDKSLSAVQLKRLDENYIVRKEGKPVVALANDPRHAVDVGVQVFKDVPLIVADVVKQDEATVELPAWLLSK